MKAHFFLIFWFLLLLNKILPAFAGDIFEQSVSRRAFSDSRCLQRQQKYLPVTPGTV